MTVLNAYLMQVTNVFVIAFDVLNVMDLNHSQAENGLKQMMYRLNSNGNTIPATLMKHHISGSNHKKCFGVIKETAMD